MGEQWARSPCSVLSPVEGFLPHSILYPNFSNPALKMLLALPMLLFCLSLSEGRSLVQEELGPSMSLIQEERLAFMLCESDGEEGLTWAEVKDCEVNTNVDVDVDVDVDVEVVVDSELDVDVDADVNLLVDVDVDVEDRFAYLLTEMGQAVPTEEDFNKADLDSDGTLKFEEWAAWPLNARDGWSRSEF